MRLATGRSRAAVLGAAYEAGIRHFDAARMYGLGQAEHELGKFIQGKRDSVTIATKFGIEVNEAAGRVAFLQGIVRQLIRYFPKLRKLARNRSASLYVPKDFSAASARRSLEASLRALNTDYVDMFLLHEPVLAEVKDTGILDYLEQARQAGHIRCWGLAGYPEQVGPVSKAFPGLAQVMQVPNDVVGKQLEEFRQMQAAFITFSPYAQARELLGDLIRGSRRLAGHWSERLDMDVSDARNLNALLLSWCLAGNSGGIVLFSSGNKGHIQDAANLVDDDIFSSKSLIFGQLVHEAMVASHAS